tara:strand:- start:6406 stop:6849 length:444 start_codon:yes stop_codon:yes gene_type:complete
MALSADVFYETTVTDVNAFPLTNAVTCYAGSLIGLDDSTGYAVLWADTANYIFAGIALKEATGDTSASPVVNVNVNCGGMILKKVSVTGVSAITNVGDKVYATDDNTLTTSATSNVQEIGIICDWYSSTTCDVQLYSLAEYQGVTNS